MYVSVKEEKKEANCRDAFPSLPSTEKKSCFYFYSIFSKLISMNEKERASHRRRRRRTIIITMGTIETKVLQKII
jgi:hypothetical protein